jgi:two-component system sensor histidine kinase QseC
LIASIRRRLLGIVLASVIGAWVLAGLLVQYYARREVGDLLDAELAQTTRLLLAVARHELAELDLESLQQALNQYQGDPCTAFQVWRPDGTLAARTPSVPHQMLLPAYPLGFSDASIDGRRWRVFHARDPETGHDIQAAECYEDRDALTRHITLDVLRPLLWALPIVVVLLWLGISKGLAPLGRLAREVSGRDRRALDAIPTETVPREVLPLVEALNKLFHRLDAAFLQQRRFTADAAHELRTPLAGIKTQAEVALRATEDSNRRRALEQVLGGVRRAGHLVEQLLVLSRIDREATELVFSQPDLRKIAVSVLSEITPYALKKGVEVELEGDSPAPVQGSPDLLAVLLRNLVDNAVRCTPMGGQVFVIVRCEDDAVVLSVEDRGPGIPAEQRQRVFERFYRLPGAVGEGSGLGLSIVQRIAALHGASVKLRDRDGGPGLVVDVTFPPPGVIGSPDSGAPTDSRRERG